MFSHWQLLVKFMVILWFWFNAEKSLQTTNINTDRIPMTSLQQNNVALYLNWDMLLANDWLKKSEWMNISCMKAVWYSETSKKKKPWALSYDFFVKPLLSRSRKPFDACAVIHFRNLKQMTNALFFWWGGFMFTVDELKPLWGTFILC